jgi:hypothetical protein
LRILGPVNCCRPTGFMSNAANVNRLHFQEG